MTDLPVKGHLTDSGATETQFQDAIGDLYDFVAQICVANTTPQAATIASDAITPTQGFIVVDTEAAAPADNLKNISASSIGTKVIFIKTASSSRVVTLKHLATGSGQIFLSGGADVVMDDTTKMIALSYNSASTRWEEMWRNWGLRAPTSQDKTDIITLLGLGTAALAATGTGSTQVPTNAALGDLAYVDGITSAGQITDGILTGAKFANSTISKAKMANDTPNTYFGFNGSGVPTLFDINNGNFRLLATLTAANTSPYLIFDNTVITSTYNRYIFIGQDIDCAALPYHLFATFSHDNGATWITGNGYYTPFNTVAINNSFGGGAPVANVYNVDFLIQGQTSQGKTQFYAEIANPLATDQPKVMTFKSGFGGLSGVGQYFEGGAAMGFGSAPSVNCIRFWTGQSYVSPSNMKSGTIKVYGITN